jgi:hypothetical protein
MFGMGGVGDSLATLGDPPSGTEVPGRCCVSLYFPRAGRPAEQASCLFYPLRFNAARDNRHHRLPARPGLRRSRLLHPADVPRADAPR